ncbi:MAG TPA: hypothetical protein VLV83_18155 [Acidobacteriota bacterium]|nr:hypothetical protein [Acidobacteriota bacterium]
MASMKKDVEKLRRQIEKGSVPRAYRALLSYMMGLRTHFEKNGSAVSSLYQGYMDMTYFALFPPALKERNLKIALLFNYESFGFEVWLAGRNRQVQRQYWMLIKDRHWPDYRVSSPGKGVDSILECDLVSDFDLEKPDELTASIETGTSAFIDDIESFLAKV